MRSEGHRTPPLERATRNAAVVPVGPMLIQTKIGALATIAGTLLTLAAARLLGMGRFAT